MSQVAEQAAARARLRALLVLLGLSVGAFAWWCAHDDQAGHTRTRLVTLHLPRGSAPDLAAIRVTPPGHVHALRLDAHGDLRLQTDAHDLTVQIPALCPLYVKGGAGDLTLEARALFDLGPDLAQVGYDAAVTIHVRPGCGEAARGRISWRQLEGPPLEDLTISERGFRFDARTPSLRTFFPEALPRGIVPVSPRTQGRYVLEATAWAQGHASVTRTLTLTSIARATGLSSLAVSQRVMLGGSGWQVARAPRGARAQVELQGGVHTFAADLPGRYALRASDGTELSLQALTHDRTPMDCGRAECHAGIARAALSSPMTHALALPASAAPRALAASGCMLDCHAVGERGLDDGGFVGFVDLADALDVRSLHDAPWAELPRALQRLGGVRCTSCHGPSALPPPEGRARILRADVCATCHDAPPRYAHVQAWRGTRMARADAVPATRAPSCARCHTTGGFLSAIGARPRADLSRDADTVGIACAACHAPHGEHVGRALVRAVPLPPPLAAGADLARTTSGVCLPCHAPEPEAVTPAASSAALWLGRVRMPAALGGDTLQGLAPHAGISRGCVGCHGGAQAPEAGRTDHSFDVAPVACNGCHASAPAPTAGADLTVRAQALVEALRRACGTNGREPTHQAPPHADSESPACGASGARARALYLALLVAEDAAAAVHNAPFARALLREAEALEKEAARTSTRAGLRAP